MAQTADCHKTAAKLSCTLRQNELFPVHDEQNDRQRNSMSGLGALILVVGPSGVGKDTLLDGAKQALSPSKRFFFPARVITRPTDAGGESHIAASEQDFLEQERNDGFLLSWRAHGLCYGVDSDTATAARHHGQAVVVNVSRSVLDCARNRLQPVRIISVTASADTLRKRLMARGREDAADIEGRIARASAHDVSGGDVITISNDSERDVAIAAMTDALEAASSLEWEASE